SNSTLDCLRRPLRQSPPTSAWPTTFTNGGSRLKPWKRRCCWPLCVPYSAIRLFRHCRRSARSITSFRSSGKSQPTRSLRATGATFVISSNPTSPEIRPRTEPVLSPPRHSAQSVIFFHFHVAVNKQVSTFGVERFKREELERKTKMGRGPTPGTVNECLTVLGSILSLAERLELIGKKDRPNIMLLKTDNKRLRYLSIDEEEKLLAAAAEWPYLQDLIIVGLATGLRRAELFSLRKEDIDLRLNLLNVVKGKGGKSRSVPMVQASPAYKTLSRLIKGKGEWVFRAPLSKGKMRGVDLSLKLAREKAGIEDVTLHTLRHTFGTRLVASGVDLRTVQELMGHSNIKTTMIHAHIVAGSKQQAIARLNNYRENCHEITTGELIELTTRRA